MPYEDRLVQELEPGVVTFRATGEQIPKEEYLCNLLAEFKELSEREKALRKALSAAIGPYVRSYCPTGDRQESLRKIRWAIESASLHGGILEALAPLPTGLAMHSVEAYQLTDYIFTAVCASNQIALPDIPVDVPSGQAIRWVTIAEDKFSAVENKVKVWTFLLKLFPEGQSNAPKRFGVRDPLTPNAQLQRIEDKLDEILNYCKQQKGPPRTGKNRRD